MTTDTDNCKKQIDDLLSLPQQVWLLGAGISKNSGIPLMYPLTDRVQSVLESDDKSDFQAVREELPDNAHVEHVLSHLGDLMAIAARSKSGRVTHGKVSRTLAELKSLHSKVQQAIRDTIRWGYFPAEDGAAERIGECTSPIVTVDHHVKFLRALYHKRRAGLDRRPPISFFTINYDTLLEDALALCRVRAFDGFCGGSMAFWDPSELAFRSSESTPDGAIQARVFKLHGSIDWFISDEDIVVRRREGAGYPADVPGRLLIYPQATKYQVTQKDPFATLFSCFRTSLTNDQCNVLVVCGYSFGDEHINEEIERALSQRGNKLTLLTFCYQPDAPIPLDSQGLPDALVRWLNCSSDWKARIVVAGAQGVYHGSLNNLCPPPGGSPHSWWTFDGLTRLLSDGPEVTL